VHSSRAIFNCQLLGFDGAAAGVRLCSTSSGSVSSQYSGALGTVFADHKPDVSDKKLILSNPDFVRRPCEDAPLIPLQQIG